MNLIHFRGLNCYSDCVITISSVLGIDYAQSFSDLWSESDLAYSGLFNAYSSKRMLAGLETMGLGLKNIDCASPKDADDGLRLCNEGDYIIVAMDAFNIPWSPIYQELHDHHYFFARKEGEDTYFCFDPTYDKQGMRITCEMIVSNAYDIQHIAKTARRPHKTGLDQELRAVISEHPLTREKMLSEIKRCAGEKSVDAALLAKYTAALINNRYLFRYYLTNSPDNSDRYQQSFDKDFFARWAAVKNGLYKAYLIRENENVIRDVCGFLSGLFDAEIAMAKRML